MSGTLVVNVLKIEIYYPKMYHIWASCQVELYKTSTNRLISISIRLEQLHFLCQWTGETISEIFAKTEKPTKYLSTFLSELWQRYEGFGRVVSSITKNFIGVFYGDSITILQLYGMYGT